MAPLLTEEEAAIDPYAALEVSAGVSEGDIKRAYRKRSLKCHPDRNSTPEAAVMFRQISLALEMLLDVSKRTYIDNKLEADKRHKAKYAEMDKKRKAMVDALNAREEDAKKAKIDQSRRRQQAAEEEAIKDAGKKLLEEAQKRAAAMAESARRPPPSAQPTVSAVNVNNGDGEGQPDITSSDLTLLLSFPSTSTASTSASSATLQSTLENRYGPIAHLVLTDPSSSNANGSSEGKKKKSKGKGKKAVVEFQKGNWGGCWACWADHQQQDEDAQRSSRGKPIEDGTKARWAAGQTPDWVEWAERQSNFSSNPGPDTNTNGHNNGFSFTKPTPTSSFDSAPDFSGGTTMADLLAQHTKKQDAVIASKKKNDEFESMTLLRMRQLEREKLAEQIRREEEEA